LKKKPEVTLQEQGFWKMRELMEEDSALTSCIFVKEFGCIEKENINRFINLNSHFNCYAYLYYDSTAKTK